MVCIYCGHKTRVTNSRTSQKTLTTWRRRQCLACKSISTSRESYDYEAAWRIKNAQGTLSPFSRDRLLLSVYKSLQHRSEALRDAQGLTETVMNHLRTASATGLIDTTLIMSTVLTILQRFDQAAAVHYTAHHRRG